MPEILQYTFMQKAIIVGMLVGGLCPCIGTFLVLRRFSMVGETLAHVSLAGVLLGILWGVSPLPFALVVSVLMVLVLEKLRNVFKNYAELSLAIIMSAGLGLAVVLMGFTNASDTSISGLLFGSIITLSNQDILLIGLLSFISIFVIIFYYQEFFYLTFDEEGARLAGIAVHRFNYLLLFLTAMVIAIGLRIVGTLLISSLMVVPVAASLLLTRGFKQTLMYAILIGIFSVLIGLVISFYLGLAPGGAIVLSSVTIFLVLLLIIKYAIRSE